MKPITVHDPMLGFSLTFNAPDVGGITPTQIETIKVTLLLIGSFIGAVKHIKGDEVREKYLKKMLGLLTTLAEPIMTELTLIGMQQLMDQPRDVEQAIELFGKDIFNGN